MDGFDDLWEFEATVEYHDFGRMGYAVVYLPEDLRVKMPFDRYPRLRVDAEVAEFPVDRAFQPGQGKYYLILSKRLLKQAGLVLGDSVNVNFRIADQEAVTVPDTLEVALQGNPTAKTKWDTLTPGKRRGLAHRVSSARTAATKKKRVAEVISTLLEGITT